MTAYLCSVCNAPHGTPDAARDCEARPVIHDIGAIPGATVRILRGDGTGELATVTERWVDPERHEALISSNLIHTWGSRVLARGDYEMA